MEGRLNDPERVSGDQIKEILARKLLPTIQFSKPVTSPVLLKAVDKLCALFGDKLDVRFYAHYSDVFDASILKHLPNVRSLKIDCLMDIVNEDQILELKNLRKLCFGVYNFDRPAFLADLDLRPLTYFGLFENRKRNFDLAPLSECENLETLALACHTKNISALSALPRLRKLRLSYIKKAQTLDFASSIPKLQSLELILGGRENIDELVHSGLRELEVVRVRALNSLGDLTRFPSLKRLEVGDQLQLRDVSVSETNLEEVIFRNCKNLERIDGLLDLPGLRRFRTFGTKLDLDALLNADWPKSMESVDLYSGNFKWEERAREILASKGLQTEI